jgi:hypothetical protein
MKCASLDLSTELDAVRASLARALGRELRHQYIGRPDRRLEEGPIASKGLAALS